jgi:Ca2+-binding EF-hand superfamily protein
LRRWRALSQGGTICGDELGMTLKSMGIYLTEEEIDDLIDKYDENGDCEFDLEEFRTMVRLSLC